MNKKDILSISDREAIRIFALTFPYAEKSDKFKVLSSTSGGDVVEIRVSRDVDISDIEGIEYMRDILTIRRSGVEAYSEGKVTQYIIAQPVHCYPVRVPWGAMEYILKNYKLNKDE